MVKCKKESALIGKKNEKDKMLLINNAIKKS